MRFGLGGAEYEIDLSEKNAIALRQLIAAYLEHARNAGASNAIGFWCVEDLA